VRWALLALPLISGCFLDRSGLVDARDGGPRDGGMDGGAMVQDAGREDAGMDDAGRRDAGMRDAGMRDAGCDPSLEVCDGVDNDCDPTSADGEDDPGLGSSCDGPDLDDCEDDFFIACTDDVLVCGSGDDDLERCNAQDDDCDGTVDDSAGCPCRLERSGGHVYLFCDSTVRWYDGRDACPSGYALLKIDGASEQSFVQGITAMIGNFDFWIGGTDEGMPGNYRWIADDSELFSPGEAGYHNWGAGMDTSGDCVELDGDASTGARWSWNNAPCTDAQRYICESL
jgi:hypothetical protein